MIRVAMSLVLAAIAVALITFVCMLEYFSAEGL